MKLNQAFWPSVADDEPGTYGVPIGDIMDNPKPFNFLRLWQEVYIAATGAGQSHHYAKAVADKAVEDMKEFTKLPYSQADQE
jgi:hypothetical protein